VHGAMLVVIAMLFYHQLYGFRWPATGKMAPVKV
jgi:hypothetical protein